MPAYEDLSPGERVKRRLGHAAERFAPVSQLTRAAGEGTGAGEGVDALIKRLVTGSLVKRLDVDRNRTVALDRAMARGQREADAAHAVDRRTDVNDYADQFLQLGVSSAADLIDQNWDGVFTLESK